MFFTPAERLGRPERLGFIPKLLISMIVLFSKETLSIWLRKKSTTLHLSPRAGDKRLFIRFDELEAAWELYTPLLHEIDTKKVTNLEGSTHRPSHHCIQSFYTLPLPCITIL